MPRDQAWDMGVMVLAGPYLAGYLAALEDARALLLQRPLARRQVADCLQSLADTAPDRAVALAGAAVEPPPLVPVA